MGGDDGFAGRTAVVTGAGGGMGLRIACDLVAAGASVIGIDLKPRPAELAGAAYAQGDVSDDGFIAAAIGAAFAETGRLDYLVNAAGVLWFGRDRSLLDVELEVWDR
jgi:NAD(P)-dependent dehydrogenase (short-subunit alcohol dehydrogenase family)